MKHTPGPWKVENLQTTGFDGQRHGNFQVSSPDGPIALLGENQEANAHLIARVQMIVEVLENFLAATTEEIRLQNGRGESVGAQLALAAEKTRRLLAAVKGD